MFRAAGFSDSDDSSEFSYYGDEDGLEKSAHLIPPADVHTDNIRFNERYFWNKHKSVFCGYLEGTCGETLLLDDLRTALKKDNLQIVRKFFKSGINPTDRLNARGWTSLDYAVFYASNSSLQYILSQFYGSSDSICVNADVQVGGCLIHKDSKISQCLVILSKFSVKYSGEVSTFEFEEPKEDLQYENKICKVLNVTQCDATALFLGCIQLPSLIPIFKNLPFDVFLMLKDEDLQEMGVPQFAFRKHIIGAIDQFHRCQWSPLSLGLFGNSKRRLRGEDLVAFFKNLKFQLKVVECSMAYAKRLIVKNQQGNPKFANDIKVRYIKTRKNLQILYDEILKFRKEADKVCKKLTKPPHLIEFRSGPKFTFGSKCLAVACLSLLGLDEGTYFVLVFAVIKTFIYFCFGY